MSARFILAIAAAIGVSLPASADFWQGFYVTDKPAQPAQKTTKPAASKPSNDSSLLCLAEILRAQERFEIPDNLLLAIGIQEAGRNSKSGLTVWPWTINAEGQGKFFQSKPEVVNWIQAKRKQGTKSIDVGCMQINLKWHGQAFSSIEQALDPAENVGYAARFLLGLYRETGDWGLAAGRYHSATPKHQTVYLNALARNHKVARASAGEMSKRVAALTGVARRTAVVEPAPKLPKPPVFWTSALNKTTDADKGGNTGFSLYSNSPLQPVLPKYRSMF